MARLRNLTARSRRWQRPRASPSGFIPLPSLDSTNSRNSRGRTSGPALVDNPMLAPPLVDNPISHHRSPTTPSRITARQQPHLAPLLTDNLILAPPFVDNPSLAPPPPLSSI
uniref:Uncharacterized protein n=1 Tax=Fagus sylvatica TaxID=28930 RepID=A0A2N9HG13_FAGSY